MAFAATWLVVALISFLGLTNIFDRRGITGIPVALVAGAIVIFVGTVLALAQYALAHNYVGPKLRVAGWVAVPLGIVNIPLSETWETCCISVAIAATLVRGSRAAITIGSVFALVTVATVYADRDDTVEAFGILLGTAGLAVVLIAFSELARSLIALHASREEVARLQVDAERHRISRDLHDVIGRTLVTALLRNQAAIQLFTVDPDRAREQLDHVHQVLSAGQADLRRLTTGPILADLASELATVEAMCARLDIFCHAAVEAPADEDVDRVFAAIVREASTNMLKHAHPRRCSVRVAQESESHVLEFTNDGVTRGGISGTGTGIADLTDQVVQLGGQFTTDCTSDGEFVVLARIPLSKGE
ncbi:MULTISPECIES: sensor histidine kinase [unclassified Rhodococcus (in: high G+C Gram-positive bacteria)]|uniref:sensor histidine kinase n=1 Tax=unclassified Rhodococcus (in: high G+C Gram-positive bacteria) TaxID=192944 RepID=UPI0015C5A2FA|nr:MULTISPECIES: histidine kinase [unclassified Rhodococcus (in: high G+C Gram-positive bacteria)]